jgi:hypothetical protein
MATIIYFYFEQDSPYCVPRAGSPGGRGGGSCAGISLPDFLTHVQPHHLQNCSSQSPYWPFGGSGGGNWPAASSGGISGLGFMYTVSLTGSSCTS